MAYATISKPSLHFNTKLYAGSDSSLSVTGVGFQPDFVWIKNRGLTTDHKLRDSVRGSNKGLTSVSNSGESTNTYFTSFDSDGFTLEGNVSDFNKSSNNYVSFNWKGGTTSGLSGGNITPSAYSYNATAGFGVYAYTGNGSSDQTIPHGLGKKPRMVWYKRRDGSANWVVQSNLLGNRVQLVLNDATGSNTDSRLGASDSWDATNFNVGTYGDMNGNGDTYVAYAFTNIKGYQDIGLYKGNGIGNGTFVYTGFKPAWVLIKKTNSANDEWNLFDSKRDPFNIVSKRLVANNNAADAAGTYLSFLSSGFKLETNNNLGNGSGNTYLYMAVAENPIVANVGNDGTPGTAR